MNFKTVSRVGLVALALAAAGTALAQTPAAPVPNKGDVAFMMSSTVLVLLMTIPGLALFYGGLVRSKNMLSVLTQVFAITCIVALLWVTYGYSLAFTNGGGLNDYVGGFSKAFLRGVDATTTAATFSNGVVIPEFLYMAFQMTFACITPALIVGAFAERMKFSALLLFTVLWVTFIYFPMAHMVWYWGGPDLVGNAAKALADAGADGKAAAQTALDAVNADAGMLFKWGALDFAGGTVVHINAGIAGLVGCVLLGKRIGYGKELMAPHSLTMTLIGGSLLWVGWFGFNAGSNLEANGTAALAMVNTFVATAAAAVAWLFVEWAVKGQALDARHGLGRCRRPRCRHPGSRLCRPDGLDRARSRRRPRLLRLLLDGQERPGLRRLARRLRHPLHRRHHRCPRHRHPRQCRSRRRGHPGLHLQAR